MHENPITILGSDKRVMVSTCLCSEVGVQQWKSIPLMRCHQSTKEGNKTSYAQCGHRPCSPDRLINSQHHHEERKSFRKPLSPESTADLLVPAWCITQQRWIIKSVFSNMPLCTTLARNTLCKLKRKTTQSLYVCNQPENIQEP